MRTETYICTHALLHISLRPCSYFAFKPCQTFPPAVSPPALFFLCCWQQEVSRVTALSEYGQLARHFCTGTHTLSHKHAFKIHSEVRPMSAGVWRPAELSYLCFVWNCGVCVCVIIVTALAMKKSLWLNNSPFHKSKQLKTVKNFISMNTIIHLFLHHVWLQISEPSTSCITLVSR